MSIDGFVDKLRSDIWANRHLDVAVQGQLLVAALEQFREDIKTLPHDDLVRGMNLTTSRQVRNILSMELAHRSLNSHG